MAGLGKIRNVAVIGAGASGLVATKTLKQNGFNVTCYEKASKPGGLWVYNSDSGQSSAYQSLHINSDKGVTAFHDFPFPDGVTAYPGHWDVAKYFADYAAHFDLPINYKTEVKKVEPLDRAGDGTPKWKVTVASGTEEIFDAVVVANGHFAVPNDVSMLKDEFEGEYVHSHHYRTRGTFLDKSVCVVGAGNSGVDIAVDMAGVALKTYLVARSGILIRPKFVLGMPFVYLTLNFYKPWIPVKVRQKVMRALVRLQHGKMEQYGLKPLTDERVHPTTNGTIMHHLAYRQVIAKTGIDKVEGKRIFFSDGTNEEFDSVIAATGYRIHAPFLDDHTFPLKDNYVGMYRRIASPDWPGLFFIGLVNSPEISLNYVFERQSEWMVEYLTGRAELPSRDEMLTAIAEKRQWMQTHYRQTNRHTIEEETMAYTDELRNDVVDGWKRAGYREGLKLSKRLFKRDVYRRGLGTLRGTPVKPIKPSKQLQ